MAIGTKRRTQAEVDKAIELLIDLACMWEEKRDAMPFESSQYWAFHDEAIRHHEAAETLMPRPRRFVA